MSNNAFVKACERRNLELVKEACCSGNPDLVGQLYEWKPTIVDSACYEDAFVKACENGELDVVQQLGEKENSLLPDVPLEEEIYK